MKKQEKNITLLRDMDNQIMVAEHMILNMRVLRGLRCNIKNVLPTRGCPFNFLLQSTTVRLDRPTGFDVFRLLALEVHPLVNTEGSTM